MKVKQLIEQLQNENPEATVILENEYQYWSDDIYVTGNQVGLIDSENTENSMVDDNFDSLIASHINPKSIDSEQVIPVVCILSH